MSRDNDDVNWARQWREERDESREPMRGATLAVTAKVPIRDLIDERALAARLGVSCSTIQSWRYASRGPRFLKIGRLVRYRRSDVEEFLSASERATIEGA